MTELIKLEIQGVRSFRADPEDINAQTIEFDGPVTLITGENGTGKTSIIEALKFATMGEYPKELVTDPRIWDQKRIDCKVGLSFSSNDGNKYTITRNATAKEDPKKKKDPIQVNSGECHIEITDSNDQFIKKIGVGWTESKTQVPLHLGVSPSIIENVIFCHQQDSCWPIDFKPLQLKQRFDEIFGAERYDKATKALKEVLKNLKSKKAEHEKETAVQNQKQEILLKYEIGIAKSRKAIIKLKDDITKKKSLFDNAENYVEHYNSIKPIIESIDRNIQGIEGQCVSEKKYMGTMLEKIGSLQAKEICKSSLDNFVSEMNSLNETLVFLNGKVNECKEKHKEAERELGELREEYEQNSAVLSTAESKRKYHQTRMNEFLEAYKSNDLDFVLKKKEEEQAEAEENKDNMRVTHRRMVEEKDKEINEQEEAYSKENAEYLSSDNQLSSSRSALKKLESIDTQKLEETKQKLAECENERDELTKSGRTLESFPNEIKNKEKAQKELDAKYSELQKVKARCDQQAKEYQILMNAKDKLEQAKAKIQSHLSTIIDVLGDSSVDEQNAEKLFNTALNGSTDDLKKIRKTHTEVSGKLASAKNTLERSIKSASELEEEIKEAQQRVDSVLSSDDGTFQEAFDFARQCLNEENDKLARLTNSTDVYNNFKREAAECDHSGRHACPLCHRSFASDDEYKNFVDESLEKFISSLPNQIKKCQSTKKMWETRLKTLQGIQKDVDVISKNKTTLEKTKEEINSLSKEKNELEQQMNEANKNIQSSEDKLRKLQDLKSHIDFLKQGINEQNSALKTINSTHIDSNLQSPDKVQEEMNEIETKKSALYSEIKTLYFEQNEFSTKMSKVNSKITELKNIYKTQKETFSKRQELDSTIAKLVNDLAEKRDKAFRLKEQLSSLRKEKQQIVNEFDGKFNEQNEIANHAKQELQRCQDLIKEIREAERVLEKVDSGEMTGQMNNRKKLLEEKEHEVKTIYDSIQNSKKKRDSEQEKVMVLEKQIEEMKLQLDYYEKNDSLQALQNEIERLREQKRSKLGCLENIDIEATMNEYRQIREEIVALETSMKNEEDNLKNTIKDAREYESARRALSEATINLKSVEMCISDIGRYIKALDETLLEYHSQKMQEVNDTIQQLWDKTYYGSDIDSIFIKCESGKASNQQYDYRVMMKKDNAELDMMGRCSAGQKMLASIIIRLALAETFSVNCGVIALDEPTTNLDVQNMTNLATQLGKLVESRQNAHGKPFQLIIITHSAEFVKLLLQSGSFDHYYQITRTSDGTHHYSQIKKCAETVLLV